MLVLSFTFPAPAANSVGLAWDPSPSPTVAAYRIYYGPNSSDYTNMVSVANVTEATVTNLVTGATYYFAATAVDDSGLESDFSNECAYTVPVPQPSLQITLGPTGQLSITATNANTYTLQWTSSLTNAWVDVASITNAASLSAAAATYSSGSQGFFRLRQ